MKTILVRFAITVLFVGGALAQTPAPGLPGPNMEYMQKLAVEPEAQVNFYYTELAGAGKEVKGAPYTATATTESSQSLADGNRIVHKSSGLIARDSEGRVRREEGIRVGPMQMDGMKVVFINDPVSRTDYVLNPDTQVARVLKLKQEGAKTLTMGPEGARAGTMVIGPESDQPMTIAPEGTRVGIMVLGPEGDKVKIATDRHTLSRAALSTDNRVYGSEVGRKSESLGTQVIEGVSCEGVRVTRTIPAGAIGNERPIEMVSETWTSPDLHVLVLSKRTDPRVGETVYRLSDIRRDEPDPSLFRVPNGYTTEKGLLPLPPPLPPAKE